MVAIIPNEEFDHLRRVASLRADNAFEGAACGRTMTGQEVASHAISQMMVQVNHLSMDTGIEPRVIEQFKIEAQALRQKSEATDGDAHNALFVLAGEMRQLGQRAADLMIA